MKKSPPPRDAAASAPALAIARAPAVALLALALVLTAAGGLGGAADASPARGDGRDLGEIAGSWSWPLPAPRDVLVGFDSPEQVWSPGHRGIDIAASPGDVITAPADGLVHFEGTVVDRPVLSIRHDGAAGVVLSSFEPVTALVTTGSPVSRGQAVGVIVAGHCSTETCLHLGARIDGDYVSPLLLLGELDWSILLPTRSL